MRDYEFILKYAVPTDVDVAEIEHRLFEGGCDDALLGTGQKGRLALAFTRQGPSAQAAVTRALRDVASALPEARLVEVGPDWVGVTDVATIFQFSRQYMLKLIGQNAESFPLPLHEGKASLWRLVEVLRWFADSQNREVDEALLEVAVFNRSFNIAREFRQLDESQRRQTVQLAEVG